MGQLALPQRDHGSRPSGSGRPGALPESTPAHCTDGETCRVAQVVLVQKPSFHTACHAYQLAG